MALIPPFFLNCVVAIGVEKVDDLLPEGFKGKIQIKEEDINWIATGFFFGCREVEKDSELYWTFLVTNKHVLEGLDYIDIRFNPHGSMGVSVLKLRLNDSNGNPVWKTYDEPDLDVAVIPVDVNYLKRDGMIYDFFKNDKDSLTIDKMKDVGVSEGDFIYVLGYPMGIVGGRIKTVIVRGGTIARIRDALEKLSPDFIADVFVFPGNSGGPVITKPEVVEIEGTKALSKACLIGIVSSYIPYKDIAYSITRQSIPGVMREGREGRKPRHLESCMKALIVCHWTRQ